ncbi:unnamed protein product [Symbiodinium sp. CCMP2592]|nr:unnamed protein product [Symbiodinium sp. CCMP2592]
MSSNIELGPMESLLRARFRLSNAIVKNTFLQFPDEEEVVSPLRKCASEPRFTCLLPESLAAKKPATHGDEDWQKSGPEALEIAKTGVVDRRDMRQAHANGVCRPCRFFTMHANSCSRGAACSFCHLCSFETALACKKKDKHMARKARRQRRQGQHNT